ncbi:hypothetical protein P5784_29550, partial [Bacillus cereus]|nr:hypothetical protein [Bacillus cereus]
PETRRPRPSSQIDPTNRLREKKKEVHGRKRMFIEEKRQLEDGTIAKRQSDYRLITEHIPRR